MFREPRGALQSCSRDTSAGWLGHGDLTKPTPLVGQMAGNGDEVMKILSTPVRYCSSKAPQCLLDTPLQVCPPPLPERKPKVGTRDAFT